MKKSLTRKVSRLKLCELAKLRQDAKAVMSTIQPRLVDVHHDLSIEVTAHDQTTSICKAMGTLVFRYNGRNIQHEQYPYDPTYSNIISGLRMPENFTMTGKGSRVGLKTGKINLYTMNRNQEGLWIKPDNSAADYKSAGIKRINFEGIPKGKEAARGLHERYRHISYNTLYTLPGYSKEAGKEKIRCKACEQGKATKPSAPKQPQDLQIRM